jgi:hypothetical protein
MRVPFLAVMEDANLLGNAWQQLSWPQRVTLKAFYGCPLNATIKHPTTGWTELDYWAIIQGSCTYDSLGFVTAVTPLPYAPKAYSQLWAVVGRRSGKTSQLMSIILVYEAMFGGHEAYISANQNGVIYYIAQREDIAQENMNLIRAVIQSSPLLSGEIVKDTGDGIVFKNNIKIVPSSPSIKAQRGIAVPVVAMDEVAFWYNDPSAANPDYEVERSVAYAQLQFPHAKRIGISTPWTEEGLLWKYHKAGTEGRHLQPEKRASYQGKLAVFATTAAFENPLLTRKSLCRFMNSVSGFFVKPLVEMAAQKGQGIAERAPVVDGVVIPTYVAAMDPAFRQDSFGFTIVHKDGTGDIIVDVLKKFDPVKGQKLNPKLVLAELVPLLQQYNISTVYSDQYQFESLQQLALDMGFNIEVVDFTARSKVKIYGNLNTLVNQRKLTLLDGMLNPAAHALETQLVQLEKRLLQTGNVQISAPPGKHDDMAAVVALAAYKAMWYHPVIVEDDPDTRTKTLFERGWAQVQAHREAQQEDTYADVGF